jgi:hypothetical protein
MSWHRRFLVLSLTVVLLVGVGCTSDTPLTGVSEPQTQQPSPLLGDLDLLDDLGGTLGGTGDVLDGAADDVGGILDGTLGGGDPAATPVDDPLDNATGGLVEGLGNTLGGALIAVGTVTDLLACSEQRYVMARKTVGPEGGTIKVGDHTLVIPKNALSEKVKIRAEQMRGSINSVRFSPEGLRFGKPALLTMSYRNCVVVLLPKRIVYTTESLSILEVLRSLDFFRKRLVHAPIDHFSRYAVAY